MIQETIMPTITISPISAMNASSACRYHRNAVRSKDSISFENFSIPVNIRSFAEAVNAE